MVGSDGKITMVAVKTKVFPTNVGGRSLGEFGITPVQSCYAIVYQGHKIPVVPCTGHRKGSYALENPNDAAYFQN